MVPPAISGITVGLRTYSPCAKGNYCNKGHPRAAVSHEAEVTKVTCLLSLQDLDAGLELKAMPLPLFYWPQYVDVLDTGESLRHKSQDLGHVISDSVNLLVRDCSSTGPSWMPGGRWKFNASEITLSTCFYNVKSYQTLSTLASFRKESFCLFRSLFLLLEVRMVGGVSFHASGHWESLCVLLPPSPTPDPLFFSPWRCEWFTWTHTPYHRLLSLPTSKTVSCLMLTLNQQDYELREPSFHRGFPVVFCSYTKLIRKRG